MKPFLLFSFVIFFLASFSLGQTVTTIADVQDTTGGAGGGESHLMGEVVTVEGIVNAESWAYGGGWYCIQDGSGPWSGIYIWEDPARVNAYGDSVQITGAVDEWYGLTYIWASDYVKLDSGKTVEPTLITSGEIGTAGANAEAYEGVLVQVKHATISNPDLGYGEWEINDGSGACMIGTAADYYFTPANYDSVRNITGVLNYAYSNMKIEPRLAWDVIEASEYTRIQRIQQVRYSALLKTNEDNQYDISFAANPDDPHNGEGETVKVRGIVTLPTGLSDPGAGIEFQIQDPNGGPWSSILSWADDETQYPTLLVGDMVEYEGYVWEWLAWSSSETEIMVTSPNIAITSFGNPIPTDTVKTGDLRLPATAEQWENARIVVKDAMVTDLEPSTEGLFMVDDGSGGARIGDVSTAIPDAGQYTDPPLGTVYSYIFGYASNRYGEYSDSSTYKIEPLYESDMVVGSGPPMVDNAVRVPGTPNSSDNVVITVDVTTNLAVQSAVLNYSVDGGTYQTVDMVAGEEDSYNGTIPAQSDGAFIEYFIRATDTAIQSTLFPSDTSAYKLGYVSRDGSLLISDVQYSPWSIANSPFDGYTVELTGIVTADTAANSNYGAYCIQDEENQWSGIYVFGIDAALNRGDQVTVSGTISEHNPDWDYKWGLNTVMLVDEVEITSSGHSLDAIHVETGALADDTTLAESYEGVLTSISNATLVSFNTYDASFDDGSGPCRVDDDFISSSDFFINSGDEYIYAFGDTIRIGEVVERIQGVFLYSFGTYKMEVRDHNDWGISTGINPDYNVIPLSYKLNQNYPNPFNPETRIYFEIPHSHDVTIAIYNMLGQKVRTLVNENFKAGQHVVNWDGLADEGFIVPTGMYIYRIKAGDFIASKKMLMLK